MGPEAGSRASVSRRDGGVKSVVGECNEPDLSTAVRARFQG